MQLLWFNFAIYAMLQYSHFDLLCSHYAHVLHVDMIIIRYQAKRLSYYASIMLNAFSDPVSSKLCWHNGPGPTCCHTYPLPCISYNPSMAQFHLLIAMS